MYAWMWRHLPGPWPTKLVVTALLVAAVVALLFTVVFPWVEPRLPFTNVTVDDQPTGTAGLGPDLRAGLGAVLGARMGS